MSRLPAEVYLAADKLGVEVVHVGRTIIQEWNEDRGPDEYRHFCGWYWLLKNKFTRFEEVRKGPFPCPAAAYREARVFLEENAHREPRIQRVLRMNTQELQAVR